VEIAVSKKSFSSVRFGYTYGISLAWHRQEDKLGQMEGGRTGGAFEEISKEI
jgi:hypothetical protein